MKTIPRIEADTPIVPHAIATGVIEEVAAWLETSLPRRWVRELVACADTVYAHNDRFRRRVRGRGSLGRDYLWMFMRHWLAGLLYDSRPHLHARLPASFNVGQPLPPAPAIPQERPTRKHTPLPPPCSFKPVRRTVPRVRARSHRAPDYAWAAAAHFHFE